MSGREVEEEFKSFKSISSILKVVAPRIIIALLLRCISGRNFCSDSDDEQCHLKLQTPLGGGKTYRALSTTKICTTFSKMRTSIVFRSLHFDKQNVALKTNFQISPLQFKIKKILLQQRMYLAAFLDIESVFENMSFDTISAGSFQGADTLIICWIKEMGTFMQLKNFRIAWISYKSTSGCPQRGSYAMVSSGRFNNLLQIE